MKKILPIILIILALVLIAILAIPAIKGTKTHDINSSSIKYTIHTDYPKGSYDYTKRGYYISTSKMPNSPWFYIIALGTKPSGGYSAEIKDVKIDKDDNVKVLVKEIIEQGAAEMVLTYPSICLELNKKPNSIEIVDTEGNVFENLGF